MATETPEFQERTGLYDKFRTNPKARLAQLAATRISQPMREFTFPDQYGTTIPAPNISQGISLVPMETDTSSS